MGKVRRWFIEWCAAIFIIALCIPLALYWALLFALVLPSWACGFVARQIYDALLSGASYGKDSHDYPGLLVNRIKGWAKR